MRVKNKTPWVDRTLEEVWDRLAPYTEPELLPLVDDFGEGFLEYGCGVFGCVLPTGTPDVVLKLTSDQEEAEFVGLILSGALRDARLHGLVEYHTILKLHGIKYRNRPMWVIWREAAVEIGAPQAQWGSRDTAWVRHISDFKQLGNIVHGYVNPGSKGWEKRLDRIAEWREWAQRNANFHDMHRGDRYHLGSWMKNPQRSAWAIEQSRSIAQTLSNTAESYLIGDTLEDLLSMEIFLADVHTGNVGRVVREGYRKPMWVITDPGQAILLKGEFPEVAIQEV
jgi:hypothetical protein